MKRYAWLGLLLIAVLVACSKKDESWLIKVKDQSLSGDVFSRRYKMTRDYTQHPVITPEIIRQFIDKNQLNNLLLQAEGYSLKLDRDSTVAAQIVNEERRMLTRNGGPLFKAVVPASFAVTEQEALAGYESGKQEVKLSHILVKSSALADSISGALAQGADFGALVLKYTMDVNTRETGGQMNAWLNWTNMAPAFAATALTTPVGSFSRPVLTNYGYHVLRIDDRRERVQPAFAAARTEIEGVLKNQKQGLFVENYLTGLSGKYNLKLDSLLVLKILPALASTEPGAKVNFALISAGDQKKPLMTYDGGAWSVRETLDKYLTMTRGNAYRLSRYEDVLDFVKKAAMQDLMLHDARALKLNQTDEFKAGFAAARDQFIGQKCRERLVTRAVAVTDADIAAFYESHKAEYQNRPLSELQSSIRGRLQSTKTVEVQEKVTAELRSKYKPKWNEKALQNMAAALNADKAATDAKKDQAPAPPQGVR